MKTIFTILCLSLFISCERHEMDSKVTEQQLLNGAELSSKEEVSKAYFEKDYEKLNKLIDNMGDINEAIIDGKNLLFLSIESLDYRMTHFLISKGASKEAVLKINEKEISILDFTLEIQNEEIKQVLLNILDDNFSASAPFLFSKQILSTGAGEEIDLAWISVIMKNNTEIHLLSEKEFNKLFLKKALLAKNYLAFYDLLTETVENSVLDTWRTWTEKPFTKGKFRKAKCDFVMTNACYNFDQFINTCESKFHKKLKRAKSKILPLIEFRNSILDC